MIRMNRRYIAEVLNQNPSWKVIDIGCGENSSWDQSNYLMDKEDYSSFYPKEKHFVVGDVDDGLPFEDNYFDFAIASHILENVKDPIKFCQELQRVSKRGYIEVPTPLADNLVSGNYENHRWFVTFDDYFNEIQIRPACSVVHRTVAPDELKLLLPFFRESLITELAWDGNITINYRDSKYYYNKTVYDTQRQNIIPWVLGTSRLEVKVEQ